MSDPNGPQGGKPKPNPWAANWSAERPENARYDVREGEYLPPDANAERRDGNRAKGIGAGVVGAGVVLAKFGALLKGLFAGLGFFKLYWLVKIVATTWPFFLSLGVYVLFYGWRMAIIIIFALLVHELGHYIAFRNYGLKVSLPVFVPLLGAYTAGERPENLEDDAYIALAGPLIGLIFAAGCYWIGATTHDPFWMAAAYVSAFLNLFNMIPTPPFDGGHIIGALSPAIWIGGFALFIAAAIYFHVNPIFVIIIGLMGLPAIVRAIRGYVDPRAHTITAAGKARVGAWYLATLFGLMYCMSLASHLAMPIGRT
jgi:Zn-dependent protease